ncbi:MAG: cupin domain-containing protein [Pseudomonas sp.]|uniref:cupin domain-containing protein n=1 Tax=Pseudomonas sp. TaxID=306 RepID=UPI003395C72A
MVSLLAHPLASTLQSQAIVSTAELEVMRLCLPAGKHIPAHAVAGAITLICLQGEIEVQAQGAWQPMGPNDHLYLAGHVEHALRALTDAVVLVTVQRKSAAKRGTEP